MWIGTTQDIEVATARLLRRSPESLAALIVSLAQDVGPIGEHVRTFIVADDLPEAVASLQARIDTVDESNTRGERHQDGGEVGVRMNYVLDSIETTILPISPRQAFDLLVRLIERDGASFEVSRDYDDAVSCAVERAAVLIARVAQALPAREVKDVLSRLLTQDAYGARHPLAAVIDGLDGDF